MAANLDAREELVEAIESLRPLLEERDVPEFGNAAEEAAATEGAEAKEEEPAEMDSLPDPADEALRFLSMATSILISLSLWAS